MSHQCPAFTDLLMRRVAGILTHLMCYQRGQGTCHPQGTTGLALEVKGISQFQ
jgi:hypothetical protein